MTVSSILWDMGEMSCNVDLPSTVKIDGASIVSNDEETSRHQIADMLLD